MNVRTDGGPEKARPTDAHDEKACPTDAHDEEARPAHGRCVGRTLLGPALALLCSLIARPTDAQVFSGRPLPGSTAPATGTSTIRGRVFAADTGKPLRRARVRLQSLDPDIPVQTANTGADGRYEITDLRPSRYTMTAARSGYLTLAYGQRRPFEGGKPVQLADRQVLEDVDFNLPRMSVVAGRITDETGEPMPGLRVLLMQPRFAEGQRRMIVAGDASTDDAGRFRAEDVMPGAYFVLATLHQTWTIIEDGVEQVIGYSPTYYPGTTSVVSARGLTVGVGEEVRSADFSLVRGRAANISGTVTDSRGRPLDGETVYLSEFRGGSDTTTFQYGGAAIVGADGSFSIKGLAPGDYKLTIRYVTGAGNSMHAEEAGTLRVPVNGVDLSGLHISTSRGWSASGQVITDRGALPDLRSQRVILVGQAVEADADLKVGGIDGSGEIREDGTFVLAGLFGRERIRTNTVKGWMLKAVLQNGRDITDEAIELRSGEELRGLQVVLTNRITSISGSVTDDSNAPATEGTVIVFPRDAAKWADEPRYLRAARPDQQGQFDILGLPPGEYLAAAVGYVPQGMWADPELLESLRRSAQRVTLGDGTSQTVALKLVSR